MKRKTKYRSAALNTFVVILCLSVFGGSLWFFFRDLGASSFRQDKDEVATITFKYKIAQRKYNDRVVWERLKQGSPLYNGDTIRTADLAQATIHFGEGAKIEISENTMVQILYEDDGKLKISVSDGAIEVDNSDSESIVALEMGNGMIVNLEKGSKVSAKLDEATSEVGLQLKTGKAAIVKENVDTDDTEPFETELIAGESIVVLENGKITRQPITVTSVSQNQRVLVFGDDNDSLAVPLEWIPLADLPEDENVIIQTSTKKDFSTVEETYQVNGENKVEIPAQNGLVYWRIYTESDEENSVQGKLDFETVEDIIPLYPDVDAVFDYYKELPKINVSWKGNKFASKYKVEISKQKNFSKKAFETETTSQNIYVTELDAGKYFWRVTPYYETNGVGWFGETEARTFSVVKHNGLIPPKLSFPPNNRKIVYKDADFEADFSWKSENENSVYTLKIARDENFKNIVLTENTTEKNIHKTFNSSEMPDGEYFWKISQEANVTETEKENLVSEVRKFTVKKFVESEKIIETVVIPQLENIVLLDTPKLSSPAANQIIDSVYLRKNRAIKFNWDEVDGAESYDFVLYQKLPNGRLKKVYTKTITKASGFTLDDLSILDIGTFQWAVSANGVTAEESESKKSKDATQVFDIRFALPQQIETIKPGEMYGE